MFSLVSVNCLRCAPERNVEVNFRNLILVVLLGLHRGGGMKGCAQCLRLSALTTINK